VRYRTPLLPPSPRRPEPLTEGFGAPKCLSGAPVTLMFERLAIVPLNALGCGPWSCRWSRRRGSGGGGVAA